MNFSHSELSLQLSWTPRVNGARPSTPGFYLRGAYANEGTAMGVIPGSWDNGYGGHGSLLSREALLDIFAAIRHNELLLPPFTNLGPQLADYSESEQARVLEIKRSRLETLKAEVDALEAELVQSPE